MGTLRTLLAIAVLIGHSSAIFGVTPVAGNVAVEAFYIISGFYMALILTEKYIGVNGSYRLFITNRFLRLFPVYWTVVILILLFATAAGIHSHGNSWGPLDQWKIYAGKMDIPGMAFLMFTNIFVFLQDVVMFLGLDPSSGHFFFTSDFTKTNPELHTFLLVPQAWTIGIELMFYLIVPFLLRMRSSMLFILLLCSITLKIFLYNKGLYHDPWSYRFFPAELFFFIAGILAYRWYNKNKKGLPSKNIKIAIWILVLGITVIHGLLRSGGKDIVYYALFLLALPLIFDLTKRSRIDRYIGELSYPIYISHMFVLTLLHAARINFTKETGLLLTISTILFSILLNETIAKRVERKRLSRLA